MPQECLLNVLFKLYCLKVLVFLMFAKLIGNHIVWLIISMAFHRTILINTCMDTHASFTDLCSLVSGYYVDLFVSLCSLLKAL